MKCTVSTVSTASPGLVGGTVFDLSSLCTCTCFTMSASVRISNCTVHILMGGGMVGYWHFLFMIYQVFICGVLRQCRLFNRLRYHIPFIDFVYLILFGFVNVHFPNSGCTWFPIISCVNGWLIMLVESTAVA